MIPRIAFYAGAALAMAVAVFDLTGSAIVALAAAVVPFALGATNLMPFAGWALPVAAVAWALAAGITAPQTDAAAPPADHGMLASLAPRN